MKMLTPSDVEAVVDQICRTFPKVTEFASARQIAETAQSGEFGELLNVFNKLALGFQNFFPPTEAQIHRYWDEYDEWRNMLLKAIPDFPDRLAEDLARQGSRSRLQNSRHSSGRRCNRRNQRPGRVQGSIVFAMRRSRRYPSLGHQQRPLQASSEQAA